MERDKIDPSPVPLGHAVIAGAGIAGLLAAAAAAPFFRRVTLIERDVTGDEPQPRRGAPQGRHAHVLLPRGLEALERLFPGFAEDAIARGAVALNAATEASWGVGGHRLACAPDALPAISSTRPFLEAEIRRHTAAIANIDTVTGAHVTDFFFEDGRVTGVALEREGAAGPERLDADLVVDATGRASRLPRWLADNGFEPPAEDSLDVDVGYATAHFPADYERLGGRCAVVVGAAPGRPRGGVAHLVEGGMIEVSLSGYRGEHPPATREGFIAHARSLARSDLHRLIHDAELLSAIVPFHVARTVCRRYDALRRWPPGIVAIGDAICAFNPIFAQGMSVAALEALALQAELQRTGADPRRADFAPSYFRAAARVVAPAWRMARGNDLLAPHLAPRASPPDRYMTRWIGRVLAAGAHDPLVAKRFIRVACLVDPRRPCSPRASSRASCSADDAQRLLRCATVSRPTSTDALRTYRPPTAIFRKIKGLSLCSRRARRAFKVLAASGSGVRIHEIRHLFQQPPAR